MMKLADYLFRSLADNGVRHVFLVTGGGAMHLNEGLRREKRLSFTCNHHEQACAMGAEGYARVTGTVGVVSVTTGPGGINALNGVFGAWTDSVPMLVISGQVKKETCHFLSPPPLLRQLGDQEADVIRMVRGITKYAACVQDPASIRYHLERALHEASSGRPGPCWLDIPMDVQAASVDEHALKGFTPVEEEGDYTLEASCREVIARFAAASRPVVMAGSGVRRAGAAEGFLELAEKLGVPVTTAWTAHDLLASDHPLHCGRPGTVGDRAGNFTVQNADVLLVLGSRLNIRQVSYNWRSFARHALKIQVDADPAELSKPTVMPDMAVWADAKGFIEGMNRQLDAVGYRPGRHREWLAWCRERVRRYPVVLPRHRAPGPYVNPYYFTEQLFDALSEDDIIVCGNGSACVIPFQAARIKRGQRMFANSGCASMGYDLPAAIGAAVGAHGRRVVCIAGDGSIQMNIQELQTIAHRRLPIKIFVLNNAGYLSIRSTQKSFFGELIGEGPESGVTFPDMLKIAVAYGIRGVRIKKQECRDAIADALHGEGPCVCEVMVDTSQEFEPKLSSRSLPDGRIVSSPLEDLFPFLERSELLDNLLIPSVAG